MSDLIRMTPPSLSKGRLWASLAVILFGQFVVSIDLTVLNIALPDLTSELRPTSDQLLWIVDVYSLVLAGLIVATSSLSDRFGRKRTLLTGFFLFGLGSALVMIADAPEHIIAIRAFLGVAGAMIMPVTISMVRSIFTDAKERALAVALWSAISALGMATGPLIGGFLLEHFSWHAAFLVNVPFMAVAVIIGIFVLPEVKVVNPGRFDVVASVVFLAGMISLLWGIKHVSAELEFDMPGIVTIVAGVILLALFGLKCVKSKTPLLDLSLFRNRTFTAGVVATVGSTFAMAVLLYLLSQWLQLVNGDGSLEAGMKLVPMAVASLIASTGASALAMRFQARNVIAGGMVIAAAAMIMLVFFRDDLTIEPIMISTTLVGVGTGALAIGASLVMGATPVEKASSAGSMQEISYDMGNVLGVAILGSVASIIYRDGLSTSQLRAMGLDSQSIDYCEQSFSVTAEVANQLQMPDLYRLGVDAFNDSVVLTCLIGGIIILVVAVAVWALIPKGMKITEDVDTPEGASAPAVTGDPAVGGNAPDGSGSLAGTTPSATPASNPGADTAASGDSASGSPAASLASTDSDSHTPEPMLHAMPVSTATPAGINPQSTVVLHVPLNAKMSERMGEVCYELGLTPEAAMSVFAHKVARERRIPFQLALGPASQAHELGEPESRALPQSSSAASASATAPSNSNTPESLDDASEAKHPHPDQTE